MRSSALALTLLLLAAAASPPAGPKQAAPSAGTTAQDCPECPALVVLPPGRFLMGSTPDEPEHEANEGPIREVTIDRPLAVGRYEVTLAEYKAFVHATGRLLEPGCLTHEAGGPLYRDDRHYLDPGYPQTDRHPVVCVTWDDAVAYADWLSARTGHRYRLPSEAEWEYAARAGATTPFAWGATVTTDQANYDGAYTYQGGPIGSRRMASLPVGAFPANAFGLHDMAGNVWEWTQDCRHGDYRGAPSDGAAWLGDQGGDCEFRIRRGGAWEGYAKSVRSANRYWNRRDFRSSYDGFRIVREL
jgi:formylglycine-generating enzyme required for sulfatase activity